MYKLMIVDDEKNIRRGMVNGIPWEDWGFTVTATAENGVEALEKIEQEKPDVVLSDIRMPQMDGVELMQYLNQHYPEIKIIILSGYSDFEYLNVSIKNNVTEYLLKPTDVDEFEELFRRMKIKLDEERQREQQYEKSMEYYLDNIMSMLLKGYTDEDILSDDIDLLEEAGINTSNCVAVLLTIDWVLGEMEEKALYEGKKKLIRVFNQNSDGEKLYGRCFLDSKEKVVAVISGAKDIPLSRKQVGPYLKHILDLAKMQEGLTAHATVGIRCVDRRMLAQSYEQAVSVAHQNTFRNGQNVVFYQTVSEENFEYRAVTFQCEKIINYMIKGQKDKVLDEINRVFTFFAENHVQEYQYIEHTCMELLFYLSRWSMEHNINFEQIMEENGIRYEDIRRIVSLDLRKEFIIKVVMGLYDCVTLSMQQQGKNNNLAQIIKDCVDAEYMSNLISLEYVAGKVKKSAAYISKLFKDEFGCNFSEYITRKRLERSKELLEDPSRKIYEIAQMTGYADVSNFIKVFKKRYGVSPGDYRNVIGRKA